MISRRLLTITRTSKRINISKSNINNTHRCRANDQVARIQPTHRSDHDARRGPIGSTRQTRFTERSEERNLSSHEGAWMAIPSGAPPLIRTLQEGCQDLSLFTKTPRESWQLSRHIADSKRTPGGNMKLMARPGAPRDDDEDTLENTRVPSAHPRTRTPTRADTG